MSSTDLLCLNLTEVRRRSIIVWKSIPDELYGWRPDPEAMSFLEMVRHVIEGDFLYGEMLRTRKSFHGESPFAGRKLQSVSAELAFGAHYRETLIQQVRRFSDEELESTEIDRSDVGYRRKAGDFILRIAYHDAVHTGQMLHYLRTAGADRPSVWD